MRFEVEDWDDAIRALKATGSVAIACHVNPDGDALGSVLAASLGLRQLGKSTTASWGQSPVKPPAQYAYLPALDHLVEPSELAGDLFLALDCGAGDRLGALEESARGATTSINIDHHPGNDNFA